MVIFVQKIIEVLSLKIDFLKNFLEEWLLNELFENVWQEIFSPKCKWCCSNNHVWMFYLVTRAFEESLCFWWNEFACNHLKVVRLNLFSGGKCPFRRSFGGRCFTYVENMFEFHSWLHGKSQTHAGNLVLLLYKSQRMLKKYHADWNIHPKWKF